MAGIVVATLAIEDYGRAVAVYPTECPATPSLVDAAADVRRCYAHSDYAGSQTCPFLYGTASRRSTLRLPVSAIADAALDAGVTRHGMFVLCLRQESKKTGAGV